MSLKTLSSLAASQADTRLSRCATPLLVGIKVKEGQYQEALTYARSLVGSADTTVEKHALFNAGNICWYYVEDKASGEEYLRRLAERHPHDPLAISALATPGIERKSALPGSEVVPGSSPSTYALHAA